MEPLASHLGTETRDSRRSKAGYAPLADETGLVSADAALARALAVVAGAEKSVLYSTTFWC